MTWSNLLTIVENNTSFLISSHVNPDGDSICSQLAFYWYLTSRGKNAVIVNKDPVPKKFSFLANSTVITNTLPQTPFDVFVILDASNTSRLGWDLTSPLAPVIINIDHHKDNACEGTVNIIDHKAAATCQLLYLFFNEHGISYPAPVAEILYTGILTDTGGFQFSNTSSGTLRICANLADQGADCAKIYRLVYSSYSPAGILMRSKIWSTLTFYSHNRISSMELSDTQLNESGATASDIEGMADCALTIAGVDVGMFIKYNDTSTHFSLRSSGNLDVGKIAQAVPGGGGHTCAAGCTLHLPLEEARQKLLALINKELG